MGNKKLDYDDLRAHTIKILFPRWIEGKRIVPHLVKNQLMTELTRYHNFKNPNKMTKVNGTQIDEILLPLFLFVIQKNADETYSLREDVLTSEQNSTSDDSEESLTIFDFVPLLGAGLDFLNEANILIYLAQLINNELGLKYYKPLKRFAEDYNQRVLTKISNTLTQREIIQLFDIVIRSYSLHDIKDGLVTNGIPPTPLSDPFSSSSPPKPSQESGLF